MVDMVVAAYNPSTDPSNYTVIAVPHGHYTVYAYNSTSGKTFVNASVLCDEEIVEKAVINNCQMYVDYPIPGLQAILVYLVYTPNVDLTAPL